MKTRALLLSDSRQDGFDGNTRTHALQTLDDHGLALLKARKNDNSKALLGPDFDVTLFDSLLLVYHQNEFASLVALHGSLRNQKSFG